MSPPYFDHKSSRRDRFWLLSLCFISVFCSAGLTWLCLHICLWVWCINTPSRSTHSTASAAKPHLRDRDRTSNTTTGTGTWTKIWGLLSSKAHSSFLPCSQYFLIISAAPQMCISPPSIPAIPSSSTSVCECGILGRGFKDSIICFLFDKAIKNEDKDESWMAHMRKKKELWRIRGNCI